MGTVPIDFADVRVALSDTGAQTMALLGSLDHTVVAVPRSMWTVGEVAAHLATDVGINADAAAGIPFDIDMPADARTAERMVSLNSRAVAQVSERDPGVLAEMVEASVARFLAATDGRSGGERLATPWYGDDVILDLDTAACVVLGELVVHGHDIARALGRRWPIDPSHAALVLCGVASMLPLYVDPNAAAGVSARYAVHVRRHQGFIVSIDAGVVTTEEPGAAADCHISADPVALLLVAYGRKGQWSQIAQGRMLAWGRRPWLAPALLGLFSDP